MYINNIHILYYVALIFLGIITGQLTDWAIKRMPEYKKVFFLILKTENLEIM